MASQTFTDTLSDSAQQQLNVLREALENRLVTLEEVLADPSRGESLAGLILDLSQIATEEAEAAASRACLATRAEADKEITELRTSAKAALEAAQTALRSAHDSLEQERAIGADLRRMADQAQLEIQKQAELLAAREQLEASLQGAREQLEASLKDARDQLEAEVARHKTIVADRQRATADAQQQLETERASARKAYENVAAELAHERGALAGRERAHAELQAELDAERASRASVRGAIERAETRVAMLERELEDARIAHEAAIADLVRQREAAAVDAAELEASLGRETSQGRTVHKELSSELARQRESAALLQKALAEGHQALAAAGADLQGERTSNADLRQAVEYANQQLASARSNETLALANHEQLMSELDRLRAEAASATMVAAGAKGDVQRELASARMVAVALHAETEGLRAETQGLRAALKAARTRLEVLTAERDTVAADLHAARKWIDELREAEAEFAILSPSPTAHTPPAAASSPTAPEHKATPAEDNGWQAVRLANRYVFGEEIVVQINGNPGRLFDLSITGCQLLTPSALKPNHTVKVTLPNEEKPVTCTGTVVWTRLEPPAGGRALRYRAGVRFTKPDELAIETFAARHGATA